MSVLPALRSNPDCHRKLRKHELCVLLCSAGAFTKSQCSSQCFPYILIFLEKDQILWEVLFNKFLDDFLLDSGIQDIGDETRITQDIAGSTRSLSKQTDDLRLNNRRGNCKLYCIHVTFALILFYYSLLMLAVLSLSHLSSVEWKLSSLHFPGHKSCFVAQLLQKYCNLLPQIRTVIPSLLQTPSLSYIFWKAAKGKGLPWDNLFSAKGRPNKCGKYSLGMISLQQKAAPAGLFWPIRRW